MVVVNVTKVKFEDDKMSNNFTKALDTLLDMNLKSLVVKCPKCKEQGLAMTKWIKGKITKPLYVFHKNKAGNIKECFIDEESSRDIREKAKISETDIKRLLEKIKAYVLFSGGIDSLF